MFPAGLLDADDSGSMVFEERGERIDDLKVAPSTCCCSDFRVLQGFLGRLPASVQMLESRFAGHAVSNGAVPVEPVARQAGGRPGAEMLSDLVLSGGSCVLQLILGRVAEVATLFDDDGILVRPAAVGCTWTQAARLHWADSSAVAFSRHPVPLQVAGSSR